MQLLIATTWTNVKLEFEAQMWSQAARALQSSGFPAAAQFFRGVAAQQAGRGGGGVQNLFGAWKVCTLLVCRASVGSARAGWLHCQAPEHPSRKP